MNKNLLIDFLSKNFIDIEEKNNLHAEILEDSANIDYLGDCTNLLHDAQVNNACCGNGGCTCNGGC